MQDIITRLRAKKDDEGFTLIELLVVVVIIGVLVAIAVPVYLNYRKGAADKSAQSDVRGAISAVEQYYTDNGNTYPPTSSSTNDGGATAVACIVLGIATSTAANCANPSASNTTGMTVQVITLSDKTVLGYNNNTTSYTICAHSNGGSGKWYVYNSLGGGSVKASTVATPSVTSC